MTPLDDSSLRRTISTSSLNSGPPRLHIELSDIGNLGQALSRSMSCQPTLFSSGNETLRAATTAGLHAIPALLASIIPPSRTLSSPRSRFAPPPSMRRVREPPEKVNQKVIAARKQENQEVIGRRQQENQEVIGRRQQENQVIDSGGSSDKKRREIKRELAPRDSTSKCTQHETPHEAMMYAPRPRVIPRSSQPSYQKPQAKKAVTKILPFRWLKTQIRLSWMGFRGKNSYVGSE